MIIYLKYPRKRGFFSWEELSLVARILGFEGDLFRRNFPACIACRTEGIAAEPLLKLVCDTAYLHAAVDVTANFHFFPWNISAIHKTILLLNERLLTFAEIHLVRVAYLFYEGIEAKGLPVDGDILQKTLKRLNADVRHPHPILVNLASQIKLQPELFRILVKLLQFRTVSEDYFFLELCGRMISPQKMSNRLFHMIPQLQEPGYLQLHEFLDLVLWTELYNTRVVKETERLGLAKDEDGCFQMSDFEKLLQTVDDRLLSALDFRYAVEECTYSEPRSTRDVWKQNVTESYINPTFRQIRVPKARSDFGMLTKMLNQSRSRTKQSKFGYGNRPTTAPSLKATERLKENSPSKIQMVRQNPVKNQMAQMDSPLVKALCIQQESNRCQSTSRVMSSRSASDNNTGRRDKTGFPAPKASAFSKYRMPSISTDEDLQRTSQLIDDLKFDMATLATRSEHLMDSIWPKRKKKDSNAPNVYQRFL